MHKFILFFCVFSLSLVYGCGSQNEPLAKIASLKGKVDARTGAGATFVPAQTDMHLKHQGAIRTDRESEATLEDISRKGSIKIDPDSYYEVRAGTNIGFHGNGKAIFDINKQQTEIHIETPHGNTAVLGTKFGQVISEEKFELWVEEGRVEFTAKNGDKQALSANQKIQWEVKNGPLPAPAEFNLLESEEFFKSNQSDGFHFNRR